MNFNSGDRSSGSDRGCGSGNGEYAEYNFTALMVGHETSSSKYGSLRGTSMVNDCIYPDGNTRRDLSKGGLIQQAKGEQAVQNMQVGRYLHPSER